MLGEFCVLKFNCELPFAMNQLIDAVVQSYCTENFAITVAQAKRTAQDYGILPSLEDQLQDVAARASQVDTSDIEYQMRHRMGLVFDEAVMGFGLHLSDSATEEDLIRVLGWLKLIEHTELHEDVVNVCNMPDDPVDVFAELVALVDMPEYGYIDQIITDINTDLIDSIEALHVAAISKTPDPMVSAEYAQHLRNMFGFIGHELKVSHQQLLAYRLLKGSVMPGLPFECYFRLVGTYLNPGYDKDGNKVEMSFSTERYAAEYFAMLMTGSDSYEDAVQFWRKNNSAWVTDTLELTKIDAKVVHYITLYENFVDRLAASGAQVVPA